MVLKQWQELKAEINVPTLRTLSFHELWARMLVQYSDEYALVLRLVIISLLKLLIPADTSHLLTHERHQDGRVESGA